MAVLMYANAAQPGEVPRQGIDDDRAPVARHCKGDGLLCYGFWEGEQLGGAWCSLEQRKGLAVTTAFIRAAIVDLDGYYASRFKAGANGGGFNSRKTKKGWRHCWAGPIHQREREQTWLGR